MCCSRAHHNKHLICWRNNQTYINSPIKHWHFLTQQHIVCIVQSRALYISRSALCYFCLLLLLLHSLLTVPMAISAISDTSHLLIMPAWSGLLPSNWKTKRCVIYSKDCCLIQIWLNWLYPFVNSHCYLQDQLCSVSSIRLSLVLVGWAVCNDVSCLPQWFYAGGHCWRHFVLVSFPPSPHVPLYPILHTHRLLHTHKLSTKPYTIWVGKQWHAAVLLSVTQQHCGTILKPCRYTTRNLLRWLTSFLVLNILPQSHHSLFFMV